LLQINVAPAVLALFTDMLVPAAPPPHTCVNTYGIADMFTLNLHAVAVSAIKVVNLPVFMNDAVDTSPPTIDVDCISAAIMAVAAILALVTDSDKNLTPLITISISSYVFLFLVRLLLLVLVQLALAVLSKLFHHI
jgi:hypothetical protein